MKHVIILAVVVLGVFSCSKPDPREPFLGKWKIVDTTVKGEVTPTCLIEVKGTEEMVWTLKTNRTERYTLKINNSDSRKASSPNPGIPLLIYLIAEVRLKNDTLLGSVTFNKGIREFRFDTFKMIRQ